MCALHRSGTPPIHLLFRIFLFFVESFSFFALLLRKILIRVAHAAVISVFLCFSKRFLEIIPQNFASIDFLLSSLTVLKTHLTDLWFYIQYSILVSRDICSSWLEGPRHEEKHDLIG